MGGSQHRSRRSMANGIAQQPPKRPVYTRRRADKTKRSKRGNNGNLQRDGNEQQALTIQFNEQGRVFSSSQIEITLGNFLVHDTAKFALFLWQS